MASLIDTAISGLKLSQLSLSVTGQNIVNAETEGYSRQGVRAETAPSIYTGAGYIGTGVSIAGITRNAEQFLINQHNIDTSIAAEFESYLTNISQIDNLLANPSTSLSAAIDDFFSALNGAANNPAGLETRQLLLTQSGLLIDRFSSAEQSLKNQNQNVNAQLDSFARSITSIGNEIVELNRAIGAAAGASEGQLPNDLLDARDRLVHDLAGLVEVKTSFNADSTMNVFIGQGQGLVIGQEATQLVAVPGMQDQSRYELAFRVHGNDQIVSEQITGGDAGALLRFRDNALDPSINSLGRLALAFIDQVNTQQKLGVDLEGNLGNAIFTEINDPLIMRDRVRTHANNAPPSDRNLSVRIDDLSSLKTGEYEFEIPGPGLRYAITRLEDGKLMSTGTLQNSFPQEFSVDGFTISLNSGSFREGDSFLIQPTRNLIQNISMTLSRPEEFALGSPLSASTGVGNRGGAFVADLEVLDIEGRGFESSPGALSPPIQIRFTSDTRYDVLDFSDPANPVSLVPPLNNQLFVPGARNPVFSGDPGSVTLSSKLASTAQASFSLSQNAYNDENITVSVENPVTGILEETRISTDLHEQASTLASKLNSINGVRATAFSQLQLYDFQSDGSGTALGVKLNGIDLTGGQLVEGRDIPDPPNADFLRDSINTSLELQALGISASSDGVNLTVQSTSGADLVVEVSGNETDRIKIRDGDLRTIVGRTNLSAGAFIPANTEFDLDLGFGADTVTLQPGAVSRDELVSRIQADIDRSIGKGMVRVSMLDEGRLLLEALDPTRRVSISNVSGVDLLGIAPLELAGPDLGEQPALLSGGNSAHAALDFSTVNGVFALSVDGIYSETITLSANYALNSGYAMVAEINAQIAASTGPNGLAGLVRAELGGDNTIQFISTSTGPETQLTVTGATATQGIIANGVAYGSQLAGTAATVTGPVGVGSGADFELNGPHRFRLGVDGFPPVLVDVTGSSRLPAVFSNTLDVSTGIDFSAVPNSFELSVTGHPNVVVDLSGVNTTLAPDPYNTSPPGIVPHVQQRIDAMLGAGVVNVDLDLGGQLRLTTEDGGPGVSLTVSNPVGGVATNLYPVVGTAVGVELGGPGVVGLIADAVNAAMAGSDAEPVSVTVDSDGFLQIVSGTYGENSQISISDVEGMYGMVIPETISGTRFTNAVTVGGTLDVQLSSGVSLQSDREDGFFGMRPEG